MSASARNVIRVALPCTVLIHVVLFLVFWLTNNLFYSEVNDYLTNVFGLRYDFISLCLLISGAIGIWTAVRLALLRSKQRHFFQGITIWLYWVVALIHVVFFYGSFWYLFRQSPIQVPRLGQMFLYFRVILDPVILIAVTGLALLWVKRRLSVLKPEGLKGYLWVMAPAAAVCALLWIIALVYPPDSVYTGALPTKPLVIAHRGASMLAPENTMIAMEKAAALGAYGVETDLSISRDGVPYLMHDTTLKRTTNVAARFPGREKKMGDDFTLAEL